MHSSLFLALFSLKERNSHSSEEILTQVKKFSKQKTKMKINPLNLVFAQAKIFSHKTKKNFFLFFFLFFPFLLCLFKEFNYVCEIACSCPVFAQAKKFSLKLKKTSFFLLFYSFILFLSLQLI